MLEYRTIVLMMPRRRRRGHAAFASDSERTEQHDFLDTSNLAADIQPNSLYAAPLLVLSDPNCHSSWASHSRKHWNRTQHKVTLRVYSGCEFKSNPHNLCFFSAFLSYCLHSQAPKFGCHDSLGKAKAKAKAKEVWSTQLS